MRVVEKILGICLRGFDFENILQKNKKLSDTLGDFVVISMDSMLAISNCDHPKTSLTIQDHCMFQIKVNALIKSGERSVRNYFRLGNAFAKLSAWWSFDLHQHTQRTNIQIPRSYHT